MSSFRASLSATASWQHFSVDVDSGVATITLTRPERLNALTFEVYADLRDLFLQIPGREDVGAVIITGEGRGFCSGGDVEEIIGALRGFDARQLLEFTRMTGSVVRHIRNCPQPVIAAAVIGSAEHARGKCPSPASNPDVGSRPIQPAPGR